MGTSKDFGIRIPIERKKNYTWYFVELKAYAKEVTSKTGEKSLPTTNLAGVNIHSIVKPLGAGELVW